MTYRFKAFAGFIAFVALLGACNWRGPNPTQADLDAPTGPFTTTSSAVTASPGFGDGTMYYPDTEPGPFGVVAIAPGWLASQNSIATLGNRIASHGFVVITIDVNRPSADGPAARADQLLAALDQVANETAVTGIADNTRQAVMGHSMGGGGALFASIDRPTLKASIPLAPWQPGADFSSVTVPTMIIGCEADTVAPVDTHALAFYDDIADTVPKAYAEIADASHSCVVDFNTDPLETAEVASSAVSFLKRFMDDDSRYSPFLCPIPVLDPPLSDREATCPYD